MSNCLIQSLKSFPSLIFNLELKSLIALGEKQTAKNDLDFFLFGIDQEISQKKELKNEISRKAAKQQVTSPTLTLRVQM